jgi:hypothetical protein
MQNIVGGFTEARPRGLAGFFLTVIQTNPARAAYLAGLAILPMDTAALR